MGFPALKKEDVLRALEAIDKHGVPPRRRSTKFNLVHKGRRYPPKYVVSLAAAYRTGRELQPGEFSGGPMTNDLLRELGFVIEGPPDKEPSRGTKQRKPTRRAPRRSPRTKPPQRTRKGPKATSGPKQAAKRDTARKTTSERPKKGRRQGGVKAAKPTGAVSTAHRGPETNCGPVVARMVISGRPPASPQAAERILHKALTSEWPQGHQATFLMTPGGFVTGSFPRDWKGGRGWSSSRSALDTLADLARPIVRRLMTARVKKAAARRVRYLTIGVDLLGAAGEAELVAVVAADGRDLQWTGKSYPTTAQERALVQVVDLETHLFDADGVRTLVLGCQDLNMYSPRGRANQSSGSPRRKRCDAMRALVHDFQPQVVLQHPHSTDTPNIWKLPWSALSKKVPSARVWASGIAYFNAFGGAPRGSLRDVLEATRSTEGVFDIEVGNPGWS